MSSIQVKYIIILFACMPVKAFLQDVPGKWDNSGYISNLQSVMTDKLKGNWISDNLIHNRVNLNYFPGESFKFSLQMRNRLIYGESVKYTPDFAKRWDNDRGIIDLSMNLLSEKSFILNTTIDRLNFQYTIGKTIITIGRQRINWGHSYVWNPNDIFNVQNFFDWDYIEKPGSDALRIQYYAGLTSLMEFAAKLDQDNKLTAAGLIRFNKWGYDLQFSGGIFEESNFTAGLGWSGNIKGAGFKGEMSYFHPISNFSDTSGLIFISISGDFTLSNSLFIQSEILYSQIPKNFNINSFYEYFGESLNVKKLSFSEWNLFIQLSYPVSPLLNVSFAGMYFPDFKGFYAGPNISYSISDNMDFSFVVQNFHGKLTDPLTSIEISNNLFLGFIRYKWNF